MAAANQSDFLGEGLAAGPKAPEMTVAEQLALEEARRRRATTNGRRSYTRDGTGAPLDWIQAPGTTKEQTAATAAANHARAQQVGPFDDFLSNPVTQGVRAVVDPTYAVSRGANAVLPSSVANTFDTAAGIANAPVAGALDALGAPDAVQGFVDPLGYGRNVVMGKPSQGSLGMTGALDVFPRVQGAVGNINNDVQNARSAVGEVGVPGLGDVFGDPAAGLDQYAQRAQQLGAGARSALAPVTSQRNTQAQNMFAQGQGAQDRAAAQTGTVNYGPAQTVRASNAGLVDYGPEQRITAPTLASAQQAAMGNFGAQQSVSASQVGPAAQATAQQAQSQARNIADLDFAMANESRAAMGDSLNRIRSYVDQGPGESQAQAQLRMAQEQNLGDALSLARSGRGNAAGNMKMALSENAVTNAQTNMQAALLRANEADLWRGRQLQGLGLEQQGTTAMRGQDITAAQAQGQHAVSREQIASNVDVANAQLGTNVSLANAEQQNLGSRLNAQLATDAAIQQASLANARNIAMGQAGTQVGISNAEQANLTSRLQGQLQSDAAIQQATLANQLGIARGDSATQIGVTNANNQSSAARAQAELANALAIAQGNSTTNINQANLEAQVRQREANDALMRDMYGYGLDSQRMGQDALTTGLNLERDYSGQAAKLAAEMAKARAIRQAALIGGGASLIEELIPG